MPPLGKIISYHLRPTTFFVTQTREWEVEKRGRSQSCVFCVAFYVVSSMWDSYDIRFTSLRYKVFVTKTRESEIEKRRSQSWVFNARVFYHDDTLRDDLKATLENDSQQFKKHE